MESTQALLALSAIGHAKRLAIFRLLVAAGLSGRTAAAQSYAQTIEMAVATSGKGGIP